MCGLVAVYDDKNFINLQLLPAIYASMRHRGPDDEHHYHQPQLLMCHSRLAVESDKNERQPLVSDDGRYVVVVNGELYPYGVLRKRLETLGYQFQTHSDSELALALYQHYGEKFVSYLRGEFSIILYDNYHDKLIAVRDRFGIKPLLYGEQDGRWYFGSEAKSLFAAGYRAKWNRQSLGECFSYQYLGFGSSLFAGLKQLPAGHILSLQKGKLCLQQYWQTQFFSQESAKKIIRPREVLDYLEEAIRIRIPSKQRCAFSLSGGLDSSAVVTLASKFLDYTPDCYCVSFDDYAYDEYPLAEQYAKQRGYNLHRVNVCRDDLIEYIDQAAYFSEGLASNGQYVGKYLLNQAIAADGYRVVMSGEGADEAFMGYAHLFQDYALHEMNPDQRVQALSHIAQVNSLQHGLMLGKAEGFSDYVPSFLSAKINFCQQFNGLFSHDFKLIFDQNKIQQGLLKTTKEDFSAVQNSSVLWQQLVLGNYILKTLGDGMEMAFSIEGRLPFLDHPLFDFATSLSTQEKLDGMHTKKILRKSLKNILPTSIVQREKHPFISPPLSKNISRRSIDMIFDRFSSQNFKENPIFDSTRVLTWLKSWRKSDDIQQKNMDPVVMTLLSFSALQIHFSLNDIE